MAPRDRAWRRRKTHFLTLRTEDPAHAPEDAKKVAARPHAAQKLRVYWSTEQELRDAA